MKKARRNTGAKSASLIMLGVGAVNLTLSVIYSQILPALIGLGLTFWGAILLYIHPEEYTKKIVFEATIQPELTTLDQMLQELEYKGNAVYLPPKYMENPENTKIILTKQKNTALPSPEQIQKQENQLFVSGAQVLLLTPPGAGLTKLFEKTLGTSFTKTDFKYLEQNLPKLLIDDLELAENVEINTLTSDSAAQANSTLPLLQTRGAIVQVKITSSTYSKICEETARLPNLNTIGCPLCSAIACALTKVMGEPIMIEKVQLSDESKNIEATYRVAPTIAPEKQTEKASAATPENVRLGHGRLTSVAAAFLTVCGSTVLAWITLLTWYNMTTWSKDILVIFFGPRTGEAMSLGIGMKIVHYLLLGLALLLSGLIILAKRRGREKKRLRDRSAGH